MYTIEGTIEIDMAEFWGFVHNYCPVKSETAFGLPRFNKLNNTMEIDFAASDQGDPKQWKCPPVAVKQWEEHNKNA